MPVQEIGKIELAQVLTFNIQMLRITFDVLNSIN